LRALELLDKLAHSTSQLTTSVYQGKQ
jgi:hypothetical protein